MIPFVLIFLGQLQLGAATPCTDADSSCSALEDASLMQLAKVSRHEQKLPMLDCAQGSDCVVPEGEMRVLSNSLDVKTLVVKGTLYWNTAVDGIELRTNNLLVNGPNAKFTIGSEDAPMEKKATIYIKANNDSYAPDFGPVFGKGDPINICGQRGICGANYSNVGFYGRKLEKTWTLLAETAQAGATTIQLKEDPTSLGWRVGDQIAIATTSRGDSYLGNISSISGSTVGLSTPLKASHLGGSVEYKGYTFEMAAEVMNLERSIVITGDHEHFFEQNDPGYQDALHVIQAFSGVLQVSYTRVEYCGRRNIGGQYCLHWHILGQCPTCYFIGNTIYEANQIGLAVHGVHGTRNNWNTLWNARAVGIYTEDGNEDHNDIEDNALICSDMNTCNVGWREFQGREGSGRAGIYLIGTNNNIRRNRVAAHYDGYLAQPAERPNGASSNPTVFGNICTTHNSIGEIVGNVFHDNLAYGIHIEIVSPRMLKLLQAPSNEAGLFVPGSEGPESCRAYTSRGADQGLQPANVVVDQFDYNNQFTGMTQTGDIKWIRYTGIDNENSMFWPESKNFADGSLYHIEDSIFVGLPEGKGGRTDKPGVQLSLPAGPFTFGMRNVTILGQVGSGGALLLNNDCEQQGAPCTTQYLLKDVNFQLEPTEAPRWGYHPFPIDADEAITFIMMTQEGDMSLDHWQSIVSENLDGFGAVNGCTRLGPRWRHAYGCSLPIRRLNVFPRKDVRGSLTRARTVESLKLSGPGYQVPGENSDPTRNQNSGEMLFSANKGAGIMGFGLPVIAGQKYTLTVTDQVGAPAIVFSDRNLNKELGLDETLTLEVVGGKNPLNCTLKGLVDRPWMEVPWSTYGYDQDKIKAGCVGS